MTNMQIKIEALRIAREMVKSEMRINKIKVSSISSKELAEMAKTVLANDKTIMPRAKRIVQLRTN